MHKHHSERLVYCNEIYLYKRYIISSTSNILFSPIEYLKGVGPLRGDMLKKELEIFTFKDLLEYYPFRHVDKTKVDKIASLNPDTEYAQIAGNSSPSYFPAYLSFLNREN